MINLAQYIKENVPGFVFEEGGISDNYIWRVIGAHYLNGVDPQRAREYIKKYHINKQNQATAVPKFAKDMFEPLIKPSDEIIPRSKWDLDSLVGETEMQLLNPSYYEAANKMLQEFKPKHNILAIFQCSAVKPYYTNHVWAGYMKWADKYADAACISNPGIILWPYSDKYPYRYDEWSIPNEKKMKEILDMTYKYRIVNMCRFIRFMRKLKYEHVLVTIPNPMKDWIFEQIIEHNIDGLKDKIDIVITDDIREKAKRENPGMGGLINSRIGGWGGPKRRFSTLIKKYSDVTGDEKDELDDEVKNQMSKLKESLYDFGMDGWGDVDMTPINESRKQPGYHVKDFTASEIVSGFKKSDVIKKRIKDAGNVDKGDNKLYYKSYYWTCLDILLYMMDGDLTEDIDGLYWKVHDVLDKDKDFEKFGEFIYAYKPLLDTDEVDFKDFEGEAYKLALLRKTPSLDLRLLEK